MNGPLRLVLACCIVISTVAFIGTYWTTKPTQAQAEAIPVKRDPKADCEWIYKKAEALLVFIDTGPGYSRQDFYAEERAQLSQRLYGYTQMYLACLERAR